MQNFIQKTADLTFPLMSGRAHPSKRFIKICILTEGDLALKSAVIEFVSKQLKYDFLAFK